MYAVSQLLTVCINVSFACEYTVRAFCTNQIKHLIPHLILRPREIKTIHHSPALLFLSPVTVNQRPEKPTALEQTPFPLPKARLHHGVAVLARHAPFLQPAAPVHGCEPPLLLSSMHARALGRSEAGDDMPVATGNSVPLTLPIRSSDMLCGLSGLG
jgi:hypothetical protein